MMEGLECPVSWCRNGVGSRAPHGEKETTWPKIFSIPVMVSDLVGGIIKDIALLTACLPISCCFWFVMYRCPDPVAQKVGRWFAFKPVEFLSLAGEAFPQPLAVQTLEDRFSCGFCFHHQSVPGIAAVRQQRGFMQHTHNKSTQVCSSIATRFSYSNTSSGIVTR